MSIAGRRVVHKELARTQKITCSNCKTVQGYVISRHRTWFALFDMPLFPLLTTYSYECPGCGNSHPLVKQQVKYMVERAETRVK